MSNGRRARTAAASVKSIRGFCGLAATGAAVAVASASGAVAAKINRLAVSMPQNRKENLMVLGVQRERRSHSEANV
jgi:hypothetical protein